MWTILGPSLSTLAVHALTVGDVPVCDIICCVQADGVCTFLELRPWLMQSACNSMSSICDRECFSADMYSADYAF